MEVMNPGETDRVRANTRPEVLERIDHTIEERIRFYSVQPRETISRRIRELDAEWDIERVLEANASSLALTGLALGVLKNRAFLLISGGVLGFLLMHALQGWCPPVPLLRKLGVRTRSEIDREKFGLKTLRGDFESIHPLTEEQKQAQPSLEIAQALRA